MRVVIQFPKYGVGFDVRSGDVCFMDVHEFHGNTEIKAKGKYEELVCVLLQKK